MNHTRWSSTYAIWSACANAKITAQFSATPVITERLSYFIAKKNKIKQNNANNILITYFICAQDTNSYPKHLSF